LEHEELFSIDKMLLNGDEMREDLNEEIFVILILFFSEKV